jgi:hypothetical protein
MLFDPVFERFVQHAPICVMLRASLEHLFAEAALDELFERTAQVQYTRALTFSSIATLLCQVVLRVKPSLRAAYQDHPDLNATLKSVYEKLQHVELPVCAALVEQTAARAAAVLDCWPQARPADAVAGLRTRVVDGNFLAGTQKRLAVLRGCGAAALPGMVVALRDDRTGLLLRLLLRQDAYTNERAVLAEVLDWLAPDDLLLADRNYCTLDFLRDIPTVKRAFFVIRHHKQLHLHALEEWRYVGRTATGEVYEQRVRLGGEGDGPECRCIRIVLKCPTRAGEKEVVLLSNVPAERASAITLADLYLRRWTIEGSFQELTDLLKCEINTLGYPQAALFGFSLAVCAYNVLAVLKGALAAVHGPVKVEQELSSYALTEQVASTYRGMSIALPAEVWARFGRLGAARLARWLEGMAAGLHWPRYRKCKRAPKKPVPVKRGKRGAHRSTARLLQQMRQQE